MWPGIWRKRRRRWTCRSTKCFAATLKSCGLAIRKGSRRRAPSAGKREGSNSQLWQKCNGAACEKGCAVLLFWREERIGRRNPRTFKGAGDSAFSKELALSCCLEGGGVRKIIERDNSCAACPVKGRAERAGRFLKRCEEGAAPVLKESATFPPKDRFALELNRRAAQTMEQFNGK